MACWGDDAEALRLLGEAPGARASDRPMLTGDCAPRFEGPDAWLCRGCSPMIQSRLC